MRYAKAFLKVASDLSRRIDHAPMDADARTAFSAELREEFFFSPEHHLEWAKKLFRNNENGEALSFVLSAFKYRAWDKKPDIILTQGIQLLQRNRHDDYAETVLDTLMRHHPDPLYFYGILGKHYQDRDKAKEAIALLRPLHDAGKGDTVTANTLGNAYIHLGQPGAAIALLRPLHDAGKGNIVTASTLGNAYIHFGQPGAAIALLRPLHDAGKGNIVTANTLGNAYIHLGQPGAAIALLKPLHDAGKGDIVTASTLGNAYSQRQDRQGFNAIVDAISPTQLRDYLNAKLYFFENKFSQAQRILQPYIESDTVSDNIAALFFACLPDHSPIHDILADTLGQNRYDYYITRRDAWRENPLRAEMADMKMASANLLFELGGTAASASDREKAGLKQWEIPVAVRRAANGAKPAPV